MERPASSALSHAQLGPRTVFALCLTMVFALLAGAIEILYLDQQETVSLLEKISLGLVTIGLAMVLILLIALPGQYLDRLGLAVFTGTIIYIFAMMIGTLYFDHDMARSLHAILWFHPAFIAVTLTQPVRIAQTACWLVIAMVSAVVLYFAAIHNITILTSTALVNHLIIILSLGASAALLYSLSTYREAVGADSARIEVLQQSEIALQTEVKAKEQVSTELAQSNAVVAGFLDNMSHELRTPLNAIIGFSELIHSETFGALANEKYKEYAGDILVSGQSLLELVNNLLFFSKLSAGKIALVPEPMNAGDILDQIACGQRVKAERAEISIVTDVAGQPALEADPNALTRILNGLIDNAIKFSTAGGKIYLQAAQLANGSCEISIRDTGIGIASAEMKKIFAPFHKSMDSETQAVPGVGLGLATTKMLMDLLGGTLSIISVPGQGTCVSLVFYPHAQSRALAQTD